MINGKRIDAVCCRFDDGLAVCLAPLYSYLGGGDKVIVEDHTDYGTVLFTDTIDMDGAEYEEIQRAFPKRILSRVDFKEINWKDYEEGDNE